MKLIHKTEYRQMMMAVCHIILGGIPQLFIAWKIIINMEYLDRVSINPLAAVLIYIIPGLIWVKICNNIACSGLSEEEATWHKETWDDHTPWLFWIPLFQVHSGVLYLLQVGFVAIVRFFIGLVHPVTEDIELWRNENPYIIFKPPIFYN